MAIQVRLESVVIPRGWEMGAKHVIQAAHVVHRKVEILSRLTEAITNFCCAFSACYDLGPASLVYQVLPAQTVFRLLIPKVANCPTILILH